MSERFPADRSRHQPGAFSLVEVLVVIAIFVLLLGLITSFEGRRTIRGDQVKASVDELVTVLRECRQLAMEHKAIYGVTFNIANAPGSTGQVLNNRGGGHWYRIVGPNDPGAWGGVYHAPMPFFNDEYSWDNCGNWQDGSGMHEFWWWLTVIQSEYLGPKHVLPKGAVRFVALTDEDNGNAWGLDSGASAADPTFPATYPRPWFGAFLQGPHDASPRLYAWGGYEQDSAFRDQTPTDQWRQARTASDGSYVNYTGFYYQGDDAPIVGCTNPTSRSSISDPDAMTHGPNGSQTYYVLRQGEVRPLINGDWLDCFVVFNPDGTAKMADWLSTRHQFGQYCFNGWCYWNDLNGNHRMPQFAVGDMCNCYNSGYPNIPYNNRFEASNYDQVTGAYYITLGPDLPDDTVSYPDAQSALQAMMPLYRVSIAHTGEIKSFKVSNTVPAGVTLDSRWTTSMYATPALGFNGYYNNLALGTNGQSLVPATDFVTADMLAQQQWWIDP